MKKSTKAALLSALVFPGMGHFIVKKPVQGVAALVIALASLYVLISNAIERAQSIVAKIQSGEISPDVASITQLVSQSSVGADTQLLNAATAILFVVWIFGIVDSYRIGRKMQDKEGENEQ